MRARHITIGLLAAVLAGACGVDSVDSMAGGGSGDRATFTLDRGSITVRQTGRISQSGAVSAALDYSGPLGCKGHYFHASYTEHTALDFQYSAVDAVLAIGSDVYHFAEPPARRGGQLVWDDTLGTGDARRHVGARISCPLPTDAPTALLPPG